MKHLKAAIAFLFLTSLTYAQDSTSTKMLSHEIGFNTVQIITQIAQIKTSNVTQLPYTVFYNLYYKDKYGLRLGLGMNTSYNEDGVNQQQYPTTNTSNDVNFRIGLSYNYVKYKRVVLNAFVDYVYENVKLESVSSATAQSFPNPVITSYGKQSTVINGAGFQIGTGIKLNINKHIALYMELPFVYLREKINVHNILKETGVDQDVTFNTASRHFKSNFILPATIYFVLKF